MTLRNPAAWINFNCLPSIDSEEKMALLGDEPWLFYPSTEGP
jgi:hypothetical protein